MNCTFGKSLLRASLAIACGCFCGHGAVIAQESHNSARIEILTRGPVHEAYAEPVVFRGEGSFVIDHQPPAAIEEFPSADKPEGDQVAWIPGYWSWDADLNDFVWVTGCWRAMPPGLSWIPGYWDQTGYQSTWVPGFWAPADQSELQYLPAPPDSLEEGPQGQAASEDTIWVPGIWVWQGHDYAWRPGFWLAGQPDWAWTPAHYVYSPRGCIYVGGYWDYPLSRRGVLFAPMAVPPDMYEHGGIAYAPTIAIDVHALLDNLFCCPQRDHYYFGDYYSSRYLERGIYPWFEARQRHSWYDTLFVHQRWDNRKDPKWFDQIETRYEQRQRDEKLRPAHTYRLLREQAGKAPEANRRYLEIAQPVKELANRKATPFGFQKLNDKQLGQHADEAKELGKYRQQRQQWERPDHQPDLTQQRPEGGPEQKPTGHQDEPSQTPRGENKPSPAQDIHTAKPAPVIAPPAAAPAHNVTVVDRSLGRNTPKEHVLPTAEVVKPQKVNIPVSPVSSKPGALGQNAPPPHPEMPKPDLKIAAPAKPPEAAAPVKHEAPSKQDDANKHETPSKQDDSSKHNDAAKHDDAGKHEAPAKQDDANKRDEPKRGGGRN